MNNAAGQELIEDLLTLWKRLDRPPAAPACLRCAPVEKQQLAQLRQLPTARVIAMDELPAEVRSAASDACDHTLESVALTQFQAELVQRQGHQFVVLKGESAYQLTLFWLRKREPGGRFCFLADELAPDAEAGVMCPR